MRSLPGINDPVVIHDPAGCSYLSRVEAVDDDVLALARPADADELTPDAEVELAWISVRGVGLVGVRFLGAYQEAQLTFWDVQVIGNPRFLQRRGYVRATLRTSMAVVISTPSQESVEAKVELIDVGETALRLCTYDPDVDLQLTEGTQLHTRFVLAEKEFERAGRITIRRPTEGPDPTDVIMRFDQSADEADAVRQQIFAHQLLTRRTTTSALPPMWSPRSAHAGAP